MKSTSIPPGTRPRHRRPRAGPVRLRWPGNAATPAETGDGASGSVAIDGSSTVYPMSNAAAELLSEQNPNIQVTVGEAGTGGGFEKFCAGQTDISDASRPIEDGRDRDLRGERDRVHRAAGRHRRVDRRGPRQRPSVDCLTDRPAQDAVGARTPRARSTTGTRSTPTSPTEPIALFGPARTRAPSTTSPTRSTARRARAAPTTTPSEDDNVIVQGVRGSPSALGYFGFSYYEENADTLKAVEIDGGNGCVEPSAETAQDGTYTPLARPLFIYVSNTAVRRQAAGRGVRRLLRRERRRDRRGRPVHPAQRGADHRDCRTPLAGSLRLTRPVTSHVDRRAARSVSTVTASARPVLRGGPRRRRPSSTCERRRRARARRSVDGVPAASPAALSVADHGRDRAGAAACRRSTFFREVSIWDFLTGTRWAPTFADAELRGPPAGHRRRFWTTVIALVVAVPFGLGAAIYLAEYASRRVRKVFKPLLELLAGIPSVVYGYLRADLRRPDLAAGLLNVDVGTYSVLSAGLVLGVMIIPTIASLSEDAMSAVPQALRQGSLALGANKMRTTLRVVFPAAISGIAAAVVLGLSRAVGETMIVALAAGTRGPDRHRPTRTARR